MYDWIFSWKTLVDVGLAQNYMSRCRFGTKLCHGGNVFQFMKLVKIDGGRGFRTGKNVFRIGGNTFYDRKNKIPMKIPESKRSEIGKIAEFRGIPNRFSNLALMILFIVPNISRHT
jgi:hypothetical protein